VVDVKFCGLTRAADARAAAALGAAYLGVIFAGGPRRLDAVRAKAVLDAAAGVGIARRVGVFGAESAADMAALAAGVGLDVVQLHGDAGPRLVALLRQSFDGQVWRVVRIGRDTPDAVLRAAGDGVDAVVIDTLVEGAQGGTGVALDWERLAAMFDRVGRPRRLVLAGGLRPGNVATAIGLVAPDVVDVSSGVESATGIKDHALMRAFAVAARGGR
jgi:phosphoribosylanthranilate isomerase